MAAAVLRLRLPPPASRRGLGRLLKIGGLLRYKQRHGGLGREIEKAGVLQVGPKRLIKDRHESLRIPAPTEIRHRELRLGASRDLDGGPVLGMDKQQGPGRNPEYDG